MLFKKEYLILRNTIWKNKQREVEEDQMNE
jgi:hypothetical protein